MGQTVIKDYERLFEAYKCCINQTRQWIQRKWKHSCGLCRYVSIWSNQHIPDTEGRCWMVYAGLLHCCHLTAYQDEQKTQTETEQGTGWEKKKHSLLTSVTGMTLPQLPLPCLLLPVNFGAPQSWVSTKLHIMSSRRGGRGGGFGRKRCWGGMGGLPSVLLGKLHKWLQLFCLMKSHCLEAAWF